MPIATIKQKIAPYLGNKKYEPQKSFVDAGAGAAAAAAAAVRDRLVALTCARQQTNTPKTHITLLQFFCRALWESGLPLTKNKIICYYICGNVAVVHR